MVDDRTLYQTDLTGLTPLHRGKVRDLYAIDDNRLLIVTTDRMSAFDVVLPDPIPGKGRVLTQISLFWFERTRALVPNHLTGLPLSAAVPDAAERAALEGRAMIVQRLRALPIEAVVRGYLIGSGWNDYQSSGQICGIALPPGLQQAQALPAPIFTPATKAALGEHDQNISFDIVQSMLGARACRPGARHRAGAVPGRLHARARTRHHHRRHQVRIRPGCHRPPDADGRGAHARLLALLASRHLPGRHQPAVVRQAVRARLPRDPALGQAPARPAPAAARSSRRSAPSTTRRCGA